MKKLIVIVLLTFISIPAWAYVVGTTNFMPNTYPDHFCREPVRPFSDDSSSWSFFEREVAEYGRCIEEYVEAAENDRRRILDKANDAIHEYNNFIRMLQAGF